MVDGESAVLPAFAASDLDDLAASLPDSELNEPELDEEVSSNSRPSRPFRDNGWMDADHYFDAELPTDQHDPNEWTKTYKDIDEIQVNAAIKRQWKRGRDEVKQVIAQCRKVIKRE